MPNTANAKKALRKSLKRRAENRPKRAALRTALKKARVAIAGDDAELTEEQFRLAVKKLDQSAAKGLIHKNKASRLKSRLAAAKKAAQTAE